MKIATKTGDKGETSLLGSSRVSKSDDRIKCVGEIDELSSSIGLLKCENINPNDLYFLSKIQKILILIMGEIIEDTNKNKYKFDLLSEKDLMELDKEVEFLENIPNIIPNDWVLYGANKISAYSDFSSKICRRAERAVIDSNLKFNRKYRNLIIKYLNRLSDFLYLLARKYSLTKV